MKIYSNNICGCGAASAQCCPPVIPTPCGPPVGAIIPYSFAFLYLANQEPEQYLDDDIFLMPVSGTLERLILSLELFDIGIDLATVGTLEFRVFTSPVNLNIPTLVASGQFFPQVTASTPINTILVADQILNVPVAAGTRVYIALKYSTNNPFFSFINGSLTGGLHIV